MRVPGAPPSSRHEIVVALSVVGALSGFGSLLQPGLRPDSVLDVLPHPLTYAWLVMLTTGAGALLTSIVWRDRLTGLLIEVPALQLLGAGSGIYGICLAATGRGSASFAAVTYLTWGGACLIRSVRLRRFLRKHRTDA